MATNVKILKLGFDGIEKSEKSLTKLYEIIVKLKEAETQQKVTTDELTKVQKEQKVSTDELTKTQEKLNNFDEAYQKELIKTKLELAEKTKAVKDEIAAEKIAEGSYYAKQAQLSKLGKEIRSYVATTDEEKQHLNDLKSQYATINESLKEFDKSMGNHYRSVGNYQIATQHLNAELNNIQKQLNILIANGINPTDEAYKKLLEDMNKIIAALDNNSQKIHGLVDIAKNLTAAFGIAQSGIAMFGVENEKVQQSIEKLAATMTMLESIETLSKSLTDDSTASYKILHKTLQFLGLEKKATAVATTAQTAAEAANTTATAANTGVTTANTTATTAQTVATTASTVATTASSVALKVFRMALIGTGIGALVVGLGLLIANFDSVKKKLFEAFPALENLKAIFMGVGNVLVQYFMTPIKTIIDIVKGFMKDGINGAIKGGTEALKNGLNVVGNFQKGFDKQQLKDQQAKAREIAKLLDKQLDDKLKNATAMYGSDYKFTKDGIELYKQYYANKKLMYDKDTDEYKDAVNEEIIYLREIAEKEKQENDKRIEEWKKAQEKRLADLQKFKDDANKILEDTAKLTTTNEKAQLADQKKHIQKMNVLSQEQLDYKLSLLEQINKEEQALQQKAYEKEVTATQEQYNKLIAEAQKLRKNTHNKKEQQDLDNQILKLEEDKNIRLVEMQKTFNATTVATNQELSNIISQEQENLNKQTVDNAKRNINEIQKTLDEGFKNLATVSTAPSMTEGLFNFIDVDKTKSKIDSTISEYQRLATSINEQKQKVADQYEEILQLTAIQYGQDSTQYQDMLNEKKLKTEKFNSDLEIINQRTSELQTQNANLQKDYWNSIATEIESKFKTIQETVMGPLFDAFSQLSAMQLEQAQKDLEQVQGLHDKAVQQITDSQNRISSLNDEIKKSSGSRRAELEKNLGQEIKYLRERESSEQMLAKQTAQMEEEIAKKEAQQRKLDAGKKIIEGIMNTSLAVIKALPNIPMSIAVGALGAIQTAIAVAQYSKLEKGGLLRGSSHSQGGIRVPGTNIELEGDEFVVNKRSTAKYLPLLESINNEGNKSTPNSTTIIKQFASGGTIDYELLSELATKSVASVNLTQPYEDNREIVVSVVDIQSGLNRVSNIRDMAGI